MFFLKGLFAMLIIMGVFAMCLWASKLIHTEYPETFENIVDQLELSDEGQVMKVAFFFLSLCFILYLVLSWFGFWISLLGGLFGILAAIIIPILVISLI